MKANITELMLFFDELTPLTNEELKTYWFKSKIKNDLIATLVISEYESHVCIIISNISEIDIATISLEKCSEVRIVDEKRKCLEILHNDKTSRCFLSLTGNSILKYEEYKA